MHEQNGIINQETENLRKVPRNLELRSRATNQRDSETDLSIQKKELENLRQDKGIIKSDRKKEKKNEVRVQDGNVGGLQINLLPLAHKFSSIHGTTPSERSPETS